MGVSGKEARERGRSITQYFRENITSILGHSKEGRKNERKEIERREGGKEGRKEGRKTRRKKGRAGKEDQKE